jgi:hypothetical protein
MASIVCACVLTTLGCTTSADSGADGTPGTAHSDSQPIGIRIAPSETITVGPGEARELVVQVNPPGRYAVTFSLVGDARDAALDRSDAYTDGDGRTVVLMNAATFATTFGVRAAVGTLSAVTAVSVGEMFATLRVAPAYSGRRFVSTWVASVRTGASCAELMGTPPPDGQLTGQSSANARPEVTDVPVGPELAVTLRAGHYIGGCAEVDDVVPSMVNEITVPVVDRPMQLQDAALGLSLSTESGSRALIDALAPHIEDASVAIVDGAGSDVVQLLDEMKLSVTNNDDRVSFQNARFAGSWDQVLSTALGAEAASAIRRKASAWMARGAAELTGRDLIAGSIETAAGPTSGSATFALARIGPLSAATAGFAVGSEASVTADTADKLVLATTIPWRPSQLVTALALEPAQEDVESAEDVPAALAASLSCSSVAVALTDAGQGSGSSYAGCDVTCTARLCEEALMRMWERAVTLSRRQATISTFALSATGTALVDEQARPIGFDGSWVGTLDTPSTDTSLSGRATAGAPLPTMSGNTGPRQPQ